MAYFLIIRNSKNVIAVYSLKMFVFIRRVYIIYELPLNHSHCLRLDNVVNS